MRRGKIAYITNHSLPRGRDTIPGLWLISSKDNRQHFQGMEFRGIITDGEARMDPEIFKYLIGRVRDREGIVFSLDDYHKDIAANYFVELLNEQKGDFRLHLEGSVILMQIEIDYDEKEKKYVRRA